RPLGHDNQSLAQVVVVYRNENDFSSFVVRLSRFQGTYSLEVILPEITDAVFGRSASIPYLFRDERVSYDRRPHDSDFFIVLLRRLGIPSAAFGRQCFSRF